MEPVLLKSRFLNKERLDKVRLAVAADSNEWKATTIWSASCAIAGLSATSFPFFLYTVLCGMVPPFYDFFCAILEHYQIHVPHLHPESVLLLVVFAYLCEGFLGVVPSVAFVRVS